jgi:hypothetical protein
MLWLRFMTSVLTNLELDHKETDLVFRDQGGLTLRNIPKLLQTFCWTSTESADLISWYSSKCVWLLLSLPKSREWRLVAYPVLVIASEDSRDRSCIQCRLLTLIWNSAAGDLKLVHNGKNTIHSSSRFFYFFNKDTSTRRRLHAVQIL